MSKVIKLTQEHIDELRISFEEALSTGKFSDGKFTFSKDLGKIDRKATVFFTPLAWCKQSQLVSRFDKEVAWHGVAKRGEEQDTFIIEDIIVYPQEVTGSTVTTDQEKYQMWLMSHEDDVFNNIRYQGHSHVNMTTSPSSVDTNLYDQILEQLEDDMFYIFMIWNKRGEKTIKIYDLRENVYFETVDVAVEVIGLEGFLDIAKEMVQEKVTTYQYGNYATPSAQTKKEEPKTSSAGADKSRKGYRNNPVSSTYPVSQQYFDDDDYDYGIWRRGNGYRYL